MSGIYGDEYEEYRTKYEELEFKFEEPSQEYFQASERKIDGDPDNPRYDLNVYHWNKKTGEWRLVPSDEFDKLGIRFRFNNATMGYNYVLEKLDSRVEYRDEFGNKVDNANTQNAKPVTIGIVSVRNLPDKKRNLANLQRDILTFTSKKAAHRIDQTQTPREGNIPKPTKPSM